METHGVVPLHADITNRAAVDEELDSVKPDVVIHLAGISNVDYCEDKKNWPEVMKVNYSGALNVIRSCDHRKILLGYLSSEHVFSGKSVLGFGGGPYSEEAIPDRHVANAYALTKLAVEGLRPAHPTMRIVRTSYLFDWTRLLTEEVSQPGVYSYPSFIYRSYMYLPHFAASLFLYAQQIVLMPDILNIAGTKTVSQYQFMKEFCEYFGLPNVFIRKRTKELPVGTKFVARRPHHAGLDIFLSRRLGLPQYSYRDGFVQMEKDNVRG